MVLHLPHAEGGFGVSFNDVTKDAAFYTTTSRFVAWLGAFSQERQKLWLPKEDLRDSSSWSSPPLLLLRDIHSKLLTQYDCKEHRVTQQMLSHWQPFWDLKLMFAGSRRVEQLNLLVSA